MAWDVGTYGQSDYLYLFKLIDGRLIGYSDEFELASCDIEDACSPESHHLAKWFGRTGEYTGWRPATLDEIRALKLERYLIGSKVDMKVKTPIDLI